MIVKQRWWINNGLKALVTENIKITKNWQLIIGKSGFLEEKAYFFGNVCMYVCMY